MNCIIVDDEPLAREAIMLLVGQIKELVLTGDFNNADAAADFMQCNDVDVIFLDIQMPGTDGLTFARSISQKALVIFTTAYHQYALDSYEIDAIDYLLKPVKPERFQKAVNKALSYKKMLEMEAAIFDVKDISEEYFFIKAERRVFKVYFKEILFIEGLKDYVILQTIDQKIMTAMNIKTIYGKLPMNLFIRVSKSYIINVQQISSFDNNTVYINDYEVPIGNAYRTLFFDDFVNKRLLRR